MRRLHFLRATARKNLLQVECFRRLGKGDVQPLNPTANQHFVSQIEQRLNALNPDAARHNQRIYSYTVVDRESFALSLDSGRGISIAINLALRDLFSFDVIPNQSLRSNLETMFQQYESIIETNTVGLIQKLEQGQNDIKEILELFAAKLMNFLRNPYSIKKVLNTIGGILQYHPTDPHDLASYEAVLCRRETASALPSRSIRNQSRRI
jgi:hypothetical protein